MDRDTVAKTAQNCNMKKDGAKLAQEQSAHLFLCLLIQDLTDKYGPVVREANVVNVLDQAFDVRLTRAAPSLCRQGRLTSKPPSSRQVVIPEFGIEKRVHADQMPLENIVFEEHSSILQLYWSERACLFPRHRLAPQADRSPGPLLRGRPRLHRRARRR
jgi:protein SSD1